MTMSKKALLLAALAGVDGLVAPPRRAARVAARLSAAVSVPDMVSVYARLAETTCVSEGGAAQSAAKPKWIPAYASRADASSGETHVPTWVATIFGDAREVDYDSFAAALDSLPYAAPLAAPPSETAAAGVSAKGARTFWELAGGEGTLSLETAVEKILEMAPEHDGVHWTDYEEAVRAKEADERGRVTDFGMETLSFVDSDWEDSLNDEGAGQLLSDVGAAPPPPPPPPGSGVPPPPPGQGVPPPPPPEKKTAGGLILP